MSTTKTLAKGTFWSVLSTFFVKFMGWFYLIIVTRFFAPDEIGLFLYVSGALSLVLLFSDLGLGSGAISRYIPFYIGRGEYNHARKVFKTSVLIGTSASLVCSFVIIIFSHDLAALLRQPDSSIPVFQILAFFILAYNFYIISVDFLGARKLMKKSSLISTIQGASKLILTVILLFAMGATAQALALSFIASFLIASAIGMYWSYGEYRKLQVSEESVNTHKMLAEMIPYGVVITILAALSSLNAQFDRLMLGLLLPQDESLKQVAIYGMSLAFSTFITLFVTSINGIFFPVITEFLGRNDHEGITKASSTFFRWIALSTPLVMLMILVFPVDIITIVYGTGYTDGAMPLVYYSIGLFIYSFMTPIVSILIAQKKQMAIVKITVVNTLLNVVLNLALIPRYGMTGAAAATMVSLIVSTALFMRLRKTTYVKIPRSIYKPLLAGALTLIIFWIIKPYIWNLRAISVAPGSVINDILRKSVKTAELGVIGALTGAVYLILLIILRALETEDVEVLSGGMKRMGLPGGLIKKMENVLLR